MKALILAAGRGSRMGEKTAEQPKCLLQVGGKALIEHQLETLADCGVGPVGIVVGYCADEIREVVGFRAEFIENTAWRNTNSLYSFWTARDWVDGPVLVLNSDLLIDPKIIESLLKTDGDAIAYDSSSGEAAEQMKLHIEDGMLTAMSKSLPESEVSGENVGVLKFQARTARRLFELANKVIEGGGENDWLSSAVSEIASEVPLKPVDIHGIPWGEIDFPFDLDRARKVVWPAIRANRRGQSWPRRFARGVAMAASVATLSLVAANLLEAEPRPTEWESLELLDLNSVRITSQEQEEQRWWRLDDGSSTEIDLSGPVRLRVASRVMVDPEATPGRYAVEASVDGIPMKWHDHPVRKSKSWTAADQALGKRYAFEIELPEGRHQVRLRLVADEDKSTLVRVAKELNELAPEEEELGQAW
ncbi:MAG: phosphocholine cytidylyltransferase family protein [Myxococcota bacterium]|jgi:choline kinase|nr:phosphocholine cytidylyltransferase family protein [Myxococcota bacterium]